MRLEVGIALHIDGAGRKEPAVTEIAQPRAKRKPRRSKSAKMISVVIWTVKMRIPVRGEQGQSRPTGLDDTPSPLLGSR
jgi:hypothetical protein